MLLDDSVDFEEIALATSGAVGADLANMMNEAAINAVKNGRNAVSQKDLFEAVEVVLVGKEKKDRILSKEERRIVSYHEVGHALVSALQKDAEPVRKDYHCAKNYGRFRICDAGSGRGKIPQYQEGNQRYAGWIFSRPRSRRNRI